MSANPRSTAVSFVILLVLFFGGGYVGEQLALVLAPGSGISRLFGFLELPAAFIAGFCLWAGAATFVLIKRLGGSRPAGQRTAQIPPGSKGFLWASIVSSALVGALSGVLSDAHGFFVVLGIHIAMGIAYGTLCWKLAQHGWVQFPRE